MSSLNKIVYADDEPDIREVVQLTLSAIGGFEVHSCENGAEAVELAKTNRPDLILLDVMMPVCTGPEALVEIRKLDELKDTPVVFITAKANTNEIEELTSFPTTGIVSKPFDPMTLADQIRKIWTDLASG